MQISIKKAISILTLLFLVSGCTPKISDAAKTVNLDAIKNYVVQNNENMLKDTTKLFELSSQYFAIIEDNDFNYDLAFKNNSAEIASILDQSKESWLSASTYYELNEGIIAGVPILADYDVWIDAGPSKAEDPIEAREWSLALANGDTMESPGNLFHSLLEPTLWGTATEFKSTLVDGEVLPNAYIFLGASQSLNEATTQMIDSVEAWEPTLEDIFTALVTMIPTMSEYFEQWKSSYFIAGENKSFIAVSRLNDIKGILNGLNVAYENVSPLVVSADEQLDKQIKTDFKILIDFVNLQYDQEQAGKVFTGEEADLLGVQAQDMANNLTSLVANAAELIDLEI
jgi:hypothetical protein